MYDGIKKALGPTQSKTAPVKSSTGELTVVSPSALDAVNCLPTLQELDAEPALEELSRAIDSLAAKPLAVTVSPRT